MRAEISNSRPSGATMIYVTHDRSSDDDGRPDLRDEGRQHPAGGRTPRPVPPSGESVVASSSQPADEPLPVHGRGITPARLRRGGLGGAAPRARRQLSRKASVYVDRRSCLHPPGESRISDRGGPIRNEPPRANRVVQPKSETYLYLIPARIHSSPAFPPPTVLIRIAG